MVYTSNNRLQQILATRKGASVSIAGVTIFMVVLMLLLAILPAYRSITDQLKNNEAKLIYLNDLKTKRADMDKLNEEYTLNENKIKLFEKYNNSNANSEVMLANLDQLAKKNNTVLVSANFLDPEISEDLNLTPFVGLLYKELQLDFRGTLPELSLLLTDLEQFPIAININSISYVHYEETQDNQYDIQEIPISNDPRFALSIKAEYYIWTETGYE